MEELIAEQLAASEEEGTSEAKPVTNEDGDSIFINVKVIIIIVAVISAIVIGLLLFRAISENYHFAKRRRARKRRKRRRGKYQSDEFKNLKF